MLQRAVPGVGVGQRWAAPDWQRTQKSRCGLTDITIPEIDWTGEKTPPGILSDRWSKTPGFDWIWGHHSGGGLLT